MTRIYLPSPVAFRIQSACRSAGLAATVREHGPDTIVTVYGPDGFDIASIRLTSESDSGTGEYTHSVHCTQQTAARELWRVLSDLITANVAF